MATKSNNSHLYTLALLRIGLGYVFLWAFVDKLFGLKFSTCKDLSVGCKQAWIHGGSPTAGFLGHATTGPLAGFYHHLAGQAWVDWLFMLGLLFVGVGMVFGTWIRSAAAAGICLLVLMWSSLLWPADAPGVDEHIIYILVMIVFLVGSFPNKWAVRLPWIKLP
ncbi:MAG TPA: hypothetical protein VFT49_01690 [Candidatus Saccharimonadales bacterium]|nr:hypothetical protein [Candidatus Saccharimonadales bacterium]